jgi:hypothetical protein
MDKNIITTIIIFFIFYLVYLKINEKSNFSKKIRIEIDSDLEYENFENNIVPNKFDINNFYKTNNIINNKITKDNFDYDYETDFKYKNNPIVEDVSEHFGNLNNNIQFLVPNNLESNAIYSVPFPENTSIELAQFTAENVTDLFKSNNMEDLYNNINGDVYRGYKTLKYML